MNTSSCTLEVTWAHKLIKVKAKGELYDHSDMVDDDTDRDINLSVALAGQERML